MFEQDYLVRLLSDFAAAIRRSIQRAEERRDPTSAADAARMLESAVGNATDLDGGVLLSLSPDSMAGVLEMAGTDPHVTEYIARSLLLASTYHADAGEGELAALRRSQAHAIAEAYGHDLSDADATPEGMEELFAQPCEEENDAQRS